MAFTLHRHAENEMVLERHPKHPHYALSRFGCLSFPQAHNSSYVSGNLITNGDYAHGPFILPIVAIAYALYAKIELRHP